MSLSDLIQAAFDMHGNHSEVRVLGVSLPWTNLRPHIAWLVKGEKMSKILSGGQSTHLNQEMA